MRALISDAFGTVIVAEHGPRGCELGAGCCSHAHLHLIPVPDVEEVTTAYLTTGGSGRHLEDLAHLPGAIDDPYLYLSPRPGEHLLWPSARILPPVRPPCLRRSARRGRQVRLA